MIGRMIPYHHTPTRRESSKRNHVNPDMARWRQYQILEVVSDAAIAAGFDEWRIFDVDERELAWGMDTEYLAG